MTHRKDTTVVLDEIDKAIIRELQADGRMAYTRLAPAVGLSQAATRQRVQRLLESGVMQIVAVTDPLKLGFKVQAIVGVCADGDVKALARRVGRLPEVDYLVTTAGRFDLLMEVICEDVDELERLLNERLRRLPGVRSLESFVFLELNKEIYDFGTR
ncbi:MAG: Lrp/AsnC family transcriptional regulator [Planctomycetota bacterium]|jgi:Lrp/AsnC family transcriptional regulator for asnA, asnC and gidA